MLKFLRLSSAYLLFTYCGLDAQEIVWEKSYGGKSADYLSSVTPTPDYGFIVGGSSLSNKSGSKAENNNGNLDYWVWKINEKGDLMWQKNFGGAGSDFLRSVSLTKDGGFMLGGVSSSDRSFDKKEDSRGLTDFWLIKQDASGSEQWQKTIGGSGQEKIQTVMQALDGGYIVGGSSDSPISGEKTDAGMGNLDLWIVKLDSKGVIQWQKTYGGIYIDELRSLATTTDGGYIVGGYSNSPASICKSENSRSGDFWILKLDKDGSIIWEKTLGGDGDDQLQVVSQTYDGGYVVAGSSNSGSSGQKTVGNSSGTDFWVLKLDHDGVSIWQKSFNYGRIDVLRSLIENEDHSFILGGFSQGNAVGRSTKKVIAAKSETGTDDFIALKISEDGEELWSRVIGSDGEDILNDAIEMRGGSYLLAGTSNGKSSRDRNSNVGSSDFWLVKLDDKSKPKKEPLPIEAFPNPAVMYTNIIIGYDFSSGTATLVDISGHILQQFPIYQRTVPINMQPYADGIYIVNIHTDVQDSGIKIIKTSK